MRLYGEGVIRAIEQWQEGEAWQTNGRLVRWTDAREILLGQALVLMQRLETISQLRDEGLRFDVDDAFEQVGVGHEFFRLLLKVDPCTEMVDVLPIGRSSQKVGLLAKMLSKRLDETLFSTSPDFDPSGQERCTETLLERLFEIVLELQLSTQMSRIVTKDLVQLLL
jgi:hypothetical protein